MYAMQAQSPSPLDEARANADRTERLLRWALLPPLPLIALGVLLLQIFAAGHAAGPHSPAVLPWYKDFFIGSLFAVYAFGQLTALAQIRGLGRGLRKAKAALGTLPRSIATPIPDMLARLQAMKSPGHLSDLVGQWLRLGIDGDASPISALMEKAGRRRAKAVEKKIGIHATLNRAMLKLGFLGTLLGLIVTFPPMKLAILTLDPKNAEKGASFVQHIAGAIDGDQYAILATLIATGFSLFIELLTVQILRAVCARFEAVNAGVDEWCLAELQPALRRASKTDPEGMLARQRAFQERMLQAEREFQEQWLRTQAEAHGRLHEAWRTGDAAIAQMQRESLTALGASLQANGQKAMETQNALAASMESLGRIVRGVAEGVQQIASMHLQYGRRQDELLAYERQYRSFLEARDGAVVPARLKPELG